MRDTAHPVDFDLTPEQLELRDRVRAYADDVLAPLAGGWDRAGRVDDPAPLDALAGMGLHGLCLPREHGGGGATVLDAVLCIEQLARVSSLCAVGVFESNVGPAQVVARFGTEEQRRRFLEPVCRGELQMSVSMTEPEHGSDLTDLETRGELRDGEVHIDGLKAPTGGGGESGAYLVYCRLADVPGARGIGGVIVERDAPGLTFEPYPEYMGFRGIPVAALRFEDCRVPEENVVLRPGQFAALMECFNIERCGNTAAALGLATGALEHAVAFARERTTWGRPICERGAVQQMVADMATRVDAARLLTYRAATVAEGGAGAVKEVSMAKLFANETAKAVTDMAMEIMGVRGHRVDHPVERLLRDSRAWPIAGGTLQIQRLTIASAVFGRRFDQRAPG